MKKSFPFFVLLCFAMPALAQRTDKKLTQQINELLTGFKGHVGVYVHDLQKNKIVAIHADTIYPTASMVKVPILVGVMDKIKRGELDYHQTIEHNMGGDKQHREKW
jgi:beta-lactamase class A